MDVLIEAINHIRRRPLRSALAVVQTAVAVAAITAVLSALLTYQQQVSAEFGKMSDLIDVTPMKEVTDGRADGKSYQVLELFSSSNLNAIKREVGSVEYATPIVGELQVEGVLNGVRYEISGATSVGADFCRMGVVDILDGAGLSDADVRQGGQVMLISRQLAHQLWPKASPLGEVLTLTRSDGRGSASVRPYTVIGVFSRPEFSLGPMSPRLSESNIILPAAAGASYGHVLFLAKPGKVDVARRELQAFALKEFGDDGQSVKPTTVREARESILKTLMLPISILGFMSTVALIVGCIGIFSSTAVAAVERVREIGIRRAVGATKGQVVALILAESVILAVCGSILGVLISSPLPGRISDFLGGTRLGLQAATGVHPWAVVMAVCAAAIAGILLGLPSALQAVRMAPSDAIREV